MFDVNTARIGFGLTNTTPPNKSTQALLTICLFAALADGDLAESERESLKKLAADVGGETSGVMQEVLLGQRSLGSVEAVFDDPQEKVLAYEMARAVCEADGGINPREQAFLDDLRQRLGLGNEEAEPAAATVDAIVLADPASGAPATEAISNEGMIMRYAILNGALEILPGTLATMAIIPLQMKLVHAIAKSHGVTLGTANIKDFLATLGAGLTSQVVEGFARKLLGGIGKAVAGKLGRAAGSQAAGSVMSFASTYAIGHVADRYYAGGQKLPMAEIQALAVEFTQRAKDLYSTKLPEIQESAKNLNPSALLDMVKGKASA